MQKQIIDLLKRNEKILILPSSPADGDCLGSAISMYLILKKLGKSPTVVCEDTIPDLLKFLPNIQIVGSKVLSSKDLVINIDCSMAQIDTIKTKKVGDLTQLIITPKGEGHFTHRDIQLNKGEIDFDLLITVDTAELSQLGSFYEEHISIFQELPSINIDHHVSNTHFGKINYVDIMASSTTELLLPLYEEMEKVKKISLIDEDIATLLLTGIITDTGSFQNANTTPRAFAKAAELVAYGARQQEIIQHIYKTKQLSQLKLWGRVLSKIQTDQSHRIVWSTVSQQDLKDTESKIEQTGDIIDELMTNAPGAEVILLIKEKEDNVVSVSVRTTSAAVDGAAIAENFGGGGHTQAAGFKLTNTELRDAEYLVIEYVRKMQAERLGIAENNDDQPEPMIDVEKLQKRAEEAQKATENMIKVEKTTKKSPKKKADFKPAPPKESHGGEVIYKFED